MNIAIKNGYDHILYSFKKRELIERKHRSLRNKFLFKSDETWIDIPNQNDVIVIEDDQSNFFFNFIKFSKPINENSFSRIQDKNLLGFKD